MSSRSFRYAAIAFAFLASGIAHSADIADVVIDSGSASNQSNVAVSFGQVFAPGDVVSATTLAAKRADGSAVPVQIDAKATHPDGSLRHAVVSAVLPQLGGNASERLTLYTGGTQASGAAVTVSDVLATSFDATVRVDLGGSVYTASARDLLQSSTPTTWLSGPVVSEWLVAGPVATANGSDHPHLTARFHIRAYSGLESVRVSVTLENNWSMVANPRNFNYDVTVDVAGSGTALTQNNVTHYRQARWRRVFWWGDAPDIDVAHDSAYMQLAGVVPTYDSRLSIPEYVLQGMANEWSGNTTSLMRTGLIYTYMPDGGGRPDIAPFPRWTAIYVMTQDRRAKTSMVGTSEQAGSFGIHYRDRDTDLPISLDTYPNATVLGQSSIFPSCGGSCSTPYTPDVAHQPSMSFVPYAITGDYFHLEELQFWANWNLFYWGEHGGSQGLMVNDQIRAQAWGLRTLGHAAYITPDVHPMKAYFLNKLDNNLGWYINNVTSNPPTPLGYLLNPGGLGLNNTFATWMDDFFTWSVGHLVHLGFNRAREIFDYKVKFPVGRMIDPGYCWILASTYWTRARDAQTGEAFQTWADYKAAVIRSWDSNSVGPSFGFDSSVFPPNMSGAREDDLIAAQCNSANMSDILGMQRNDMIGLSWSHEGYPSNLQPAVAIAAELEAPNAEAAWDTFDSRAVVPDSSPYDYEESPQWAVVPGNVQLGEPGPGNQMPVVSLSANPASVESGSSSTLSWSSSNADACTASGDWTGSKALSGSESTGALTATSSYDLQCTNANGSDSASVTVTVTAPAPDAPTLTLTASSETVNAGDNVTLDWVSQDADSCIASGAWSGNKPLFGNETIGPVVQTGTYTLLCSGAGGNVSRSVTVAVDAPAPGTPTLTLTASSGSVDAGDDVTLNWTSENTDSCTAGGAWSGDKAVSGNETVGPVEQTSSYSLTCSGAGGDVSRSVTVTVNAPAPTLTLTASSATVDAGDDVTLDWASENADSCTASGAWSGNKALTGSETVGPLQQTGSYSLTCSGAGGNISRSLTVTVNAASGGGNANDPQSDGGSGAFGPANLLWLVLMLLARLRAPALRGRVAP